MESLGVCGVNGLRWDEEAENPPVIPSHPIPSGCVLGTLELTRGGWFSGLKWKVRNMFQKLCCQLSFEHNIMTICRISLGYYGGYIVCEASSYVFVSVTGLPSLNSNQI